MLTWRTYRSQASAPCPVIRRGTPAYTLYGTPSPEHKVNIGPYDEAVAHNSGRRFSGGEDIPEQLLREDIVLTYTEAPSLPGTGSPGSGPPTVAPGLPSPPQQAIPNTTVKIAEAKERTPYLDAPFLTASNTAVDPTEYRERSDDWAVFETEQLGGGLFRIPPGIEGSLLIRVGEEKRSLVHDYHALRGLIYIKAPAGGPFQTEQEVAVAVRRRGSYVRTLTKQTEVFTTVNKEVKAVARMNARATQDERQLITPTGDTRDAALDYGQFDGSPVPDQFFWRIETTAEADILREAVRRTLPVGTVYDITSP